MKASIFGVLALSVGVALAVPAALSERNSDMCPDLVYDNAFCCSSDGFNGNINCTRKFETTLL